MGSRVGNLFRYPRHLTGARYHSMFQDLVKLTLPFINSIFYLFRQRRAAAANPGLSHISTVLVRIVSAASMQNAAVVPNQ
jgi:hypothetical protein